MKIQHAFVEIVCSSVVYTEKLLENKRFHMNKNYFID